MKARETNCNILKFNVTLDEEIETLLKKEARF